MARVSELMNDERQFLPIQLTDTVPRNLLPSSRCSSISTLIFESIFSDSNITSSSKFELLSGTAYQSAADARFLDDAHNEGVRVLTTCGL